jgi:transcriptional regulator with XRE-family HTH domain
MQKKGSDPKDLDTLRKMLELQQSRLTIAVGNEAKAAKVTPQAGRIAREVERLTAAVAAAERAAAPVADEAPADAAAPNAGAAALRAGGWGLGEVAEACGVTRESVKRWRFGRKVPGAAARKRLAQAPFRIPTDAWDRRAGAASDSNGPRRESSRPKDRTHPRNDRTTELELRDQVTRYREMLADPAVSTDARVKAERGLSAVLTALSRIEGTHISEATIIRHPAFRAVLAALMSRAEELIRVDGTAVDLVRAWAEFLHSRGEV